MCVAVTGALSPLFSSHLLFCKRAGLGEGVTDEGLRALASAGCGENLTKLDLFSELFLSSFDVACGSDCPSPLHSQGTSTSPTTALPPPSVSPWSSKTRISSLHELSISTGGCARTSGSSCTKERWSSAAPPGQWSSGTSSTGIHSPFMSCLCPVIYPAECVPCSSAGWKEKSWAQWCSHGHRVHRRCSSTPSSLTCFGTVFSHDCSPGGRECCCGCSRWRCGERCWASALSTSTCG